ncbi:MAG: hypothetical protein AB4290_02470 [Spirulina sp.]
MTKERKERTGNRQSRTKNEGSISRPITHYPLPITHHTFQAATQGMTIGSAFDTRIRPILIAWKIRRIMSRCSGTISNSRPICCTSFNSLGFMTPEIIVAE